MLAFTAQGTDMTNAAKLFLGAGLFALAACDQSGVGGGNAAAPSPAETAAEAESDPANTLENQAAALTDAGETAASEGTNQAAGTETNEAASEAAETNQAGNSQ